MISFTSCRKTNILMRFSCFFVCFFMQWVKANLSSRMKGHLFYMGWNHQKLFAHLLHDPCASLIKTSVITQIRWYQCLHHCKCNLIIHFWDVPIDVLEMMCSLLQTDLVMSHSSWICSSLKLIFKSICWKCLSLFFLLNQKKVLCKYANFNDANPKNHKCNSC